MMKKKLFIALGLLPVLSVLFYSPVFANCGDVETTLIDCPTAGGGTPRYLAMDIVNILSVGIGIVGVIGISLFGIRVLTARDDPARLADAKKRFLQILLGLGVYLAMWTGLNWLLPGGVVFGRIPIESFSIGPTISNIAVGKVGKLIPVFRPLDADDQTLKWESSDESIATVDEFGNVTGKAIGKTTIKATAANGMTTEVTVTIVANSDLPPYCTARTGGTDGSTPTDPSTVIPTGKSTKDTPYVEGLEIHFFSTGKDDDAILIRNQDKVIVIDGGRCDPDNKGGTDSSCALGKKFVNYLKTAGVTKIDALIGSHSDWDHIQAHSVLVENFEVTGAYYPIQLKDCVKDLVHGCDAIDIRYMYDALNKKNITPTLLNIEKEPIIRTIGDLNLFFIGPPWPRRGNKGSFVFILQYGDKRFMFTGDQTWENLGTNESLELLKTRATKLGTDIKVDLFKWPHHGIDSNDLTESIEKTFFKEIAAQYIVVPNSGGCGESQVDYAVNKLGLKKYSNCGNTNLVITSNGKEILFHENQSPENWVPKKTVGEAGRISQTPGTSQACIPISTTRTGTRIATSEEDATFIDGNGCDDKTIFPGTKYSLDENQIKLVADRVGHENCGSLLGCKIEASQIVNLYESKKPDEPHTTENFWNWFKVTEWYSARFSELTGSKVTEQGIAAVTDVVVNGNRILPKTVFGHDTWEFNAKGDYGYNIVGFYDSNNQAQYFKVNSAKTDAENIKNKIDQMIPGTTILIRRIKENGNTYYDTKTFWCVIRYENGRFGDSFALGS